MARPTKLTAETQKKIIEALRVGATYELASGYGGIAYNTFNEWMKKGEAANTGAFREFYDAVKKAEGLAAVGWLAKIETAANDGAWQAAAWKLERRYPSEYGRNMVQVEGNKEKPVVIAVLPPGTWEKI